MSPFQSAAQPVQALEPAQQNLTAKDIDQMIARGAFI